MNFEVKAISSSTSSFEIPFSIFIISFSFFPKHGLGKNVASYRDTFHLVYDSWCRDSYGCNSLVEFINQRLLDEQVLQTQQVTELAATLGKLSFPNNKIVSNSDEVWFRDYRNIVVHLPDSLKGLVKPILIETTIDRTVLEFFVWNIYKLEKVTLWYRNKQIEVNSIVIWKSGHQFLGG